MLALSYSRWNQFCLCPRKFKSQFIDKSYPDDSDNYFFQKGQKIHDGYQRYIEGSHPDISEKYTGFFGLIDNLRKAKIGIQAELKLCVDKNFQPVSWFSKSAAWRAIVDMLAIQNDTALVIDWKTGKIRDYMTPESHPNTGQLHITTAMVHAHYPEIRNFILKYAYVEHNYADSHKFSHTEIPNIRQEMTKALEIVNSEEKFEPRRNRYCNYCLIKDSCEEYK